MNRPKNSIGRRTALAALGLGTASGFLAALRDRALAQPGDDRAVMFWLAGGGTQCQPPYGIVPEASDPGNWNGWGPSLTERTDWQWPDQLDPIAPYRNETVLLDGLFNRGGSHSAGYVALSCAVEEGAEDNANGMPPAGITIDQYIAENLGADSAFRSIAVGLNDRSHTRGAVRDANSFALGPGRPLAHITSASLLREEVFGITNQPTTSEFPVLDFLRHDIERLRGRLSVEERGPLDDYLGLVEDYESRQAARAGISCEAPPAPSATSADEQLEAMADILALALQCGLTRVASVAVGTGFDHEDLPAHAGVQIVPHQSSTYPERSAAHRRFHLELIARVRQAVGDRMTTIYVSETGAAARSTHHGRNTRTPALVIGNAGGELRTGGRYLRYGKEDRQLGDFFATVATAFGIATDRFGTVQEVPPQGLLSELVPAERPSA